MRRASPATLVAVSVSALAFAAAGSIYGIASAVVLRPLPYRNQRTLAWVWATRVDRDRAFFSLPDFTAARAAVADAGTLVAIANWGANLTGENEPRRVQGIRATGNISDALGIDPPLGRALTADDDRPGSIAVVMISHALWRSQFAARADAIGRSITLNDAPYVLIGVLPPSFLIPGAEVDVVTPLRADADPRRADPDTNFLRVIARVSDERQFSVLASRLAAVVTRLKAIYPEANAKKTAPRVVPIATEVFGAFRGTAALLGLCGALIVLLSAANLAHLMLARVNDLARDAAIRLALGATRPRVALLLVRTPFALAAASAGVAAAAMAVLVPLIGERLPGVPRAADAHVDAAALLAVVGMAALAATCAAVVVLAQVLRPARLAAVLGGRGLTLRHGAGQRLVVIEIALCLSLVTAALLAIGALRTSLAIDAGVDTRDVMTVRLSLPAKYASRTSLVTLLRGILDDVTASPGVFSCGATNVLPLSGVNVRTDFVIEGRPPRSLADVPAAQNRWIAGQYFASAGIPIVRGRAFTAHDDDRSEPVVVIDAALARQYWNTRDPIGDRIRFVGAAGAPAWRIVGLVGSIKHQSLDEPPTGTLYAPMAQVTSAALPFLANSLTLVARAQPGSPEAVAAAMREAVRARDAAVPVSNVRAMADLSRAALAPRTVTAALISALALTSLAIGAFGVAAVTASVVAARRREFAIRLAVGASPSRLCSGVVRELAGLTAWGAALGLTGAAAVTMGFGQISALTVVGRVVSGGAAVVLVTAIALAAALVPAWRAAQIDPATALRQD